MGASAAALISVGALTGCTLISLDDLGSGASTSLTGDPGGSSPSTGGSGGDPGPGAGGGGAGGAAPDAYESCILADEPAIYFRMDSLGEEEPNLGSFLGNGVYNGPSTPAPGLVGLVDSLSAKSFQAGSTLRFTTAEFTGGYQPVTIEFWVRFGDAIALESPERALFTSEPATTALFLTPRVAQDGADRLFFVIGQSGLGKRETFTYGDFIDQPELAFHIVAVYRRTATTVFDANGVGSDLALYVNGVSVSTTGSGSSTPTADVMQNLVIGGDLGANGEAAILDEFAIYTHELSANDIAQHYDAGLGGDCD